MTKVCFKCSRRLPLTEFYKHPKMGDGYLGKCKSCTKADTISNRNSRLEYYREYDKARAKLEHRKKLNKKTVKARRKSDPRYGRAHNMVSRAIKSGQIQRKPCAVCGKEKAHAHHDNYDFPLDVIFLCQEHHIARHKILKSEGREP